MDVLFACMYVLSVCACYPQRSQRALNPGTRLWVSVAMVEEQLMLLNHLSSPSYFPVLWQEYPDQGNIKMKVSL